MKIESIAPPLNASCVMRAGARARFGRLRQTLLVTTALLGCSAFPAAAQNATWASNPGSNDYNAAANWTPATVPTGTAFFGASNATTLSVTANTSINGWTFGPNAPAYTFNVGATLEFNGAGIVNDGSANPNIIGSAVIFHNSSTAGSAAITDNFALTFFNSATAGHAAITNNAFLKFNDTTTAGNATINNLFDAQFFGSSNAGSATIINQSFARFNDTSSAGSATITNNHFLAFNDASTAGNAAIINGGPSVVTDFGPSSGPNGDGKLSAGSIAGDGRFFLGSNELTVGGNNTSTIVSGVVADGGNQAGTGASLVKIGSGTLTLTGDNTYTGATTVNAGGLVVDGSIVSATTVNSAGMLGGGGGIQNDVTINSGGTLAPGSAATPTGTLTITGNLAFQSAAIYLVSLNGAATSNTMVSGSASLSGASVGVARGSTFVQGTQYTILHADGGVNGTFNPQVRFGALVGTLTYDTNDVFLAITQSALGSVGGLNLNQQRVANAIDGFFNGGGALPAGFVNLLGQSGAPLANALTQLSGETATGSQQTTFNAMNQFMGVMTDPFMNRTGSPGTSQRASGYAEEALGYANGGKKTDAFAGFTKAPQAPSFEQRWSVWAAGFGGSQNTSGNTPLGSNNTTSNVAATAVGADYLISPNTLAGFALAGGGTSFSVANGGSGRSDLFQLGAYVRHNQGPAYISAALAYGWQDITTNRTVTAAGRDQLRAEFNANAWSGRLEGGYRFVSPAMSGVGFTPYAAAQFVTFDLPAYAEQAISGASQFALTYNARDVTDVRSELGFRTDKSFVMPNGVLTLRGRVAWAHDFDPDRSIAATFQALPGASFVVNGAAQAADSALTTASIEMTWKNGWSVAATFEGEFSNVTSSYAGKGVVRYVW